METHCVFTAGYRLLLSCCSGFFHALLSVGVIVGGVGGWVDVSGQFVHFCEIKQDTVY